MTTLVLVLPDNYYKRFSGKTMTHHVQSAEPLSAANLEIFRTDPDSMMEPGEAPEPQSA